MKDEFCQYISQLAVKAMLYEVAATPKPGLVDRNNSGAHLDMDYYTFMASSAALGSTFYKCTYAGLNFHEKDYSLLLDILRPIGVEGEKRMFDATGGVNTHKGLIFSLGIISAAAGTIFSKTADVVIPHEEVCIRASEIAKGISSRELKEADNKEKPTYGERLFRKYGTKGIRGEAEAGFVTVREYSFPVMDRLIKENKGSINDILVQVLLHLISVTEDTNVLGRHDFDTLDYVRKTALEALKLNGMFEPEGIRKIIEMDEEFIRRNISPGGSADLLAITLMLYFMENPKKI